MARKTDPPGWRRGRGCLRERPALIVCSGSCPRHVGRGAQVPATSRYLVSPLEADDNARYFRTTPPAPRSWPSQTQPRIYHNSQNRRRWTPGGGDTRETYDTTGTRVRRASRRRRDPLDDWVAARAADGSVSEEEGTGGARPPEPRAERREWNRRTTRGGRGRGAHAVERNARRCTALDTLHNAAWSAALARTRNEVAAAAGHPQNLKSPDRP